MGWLQIALYAFQLIFRVWDAVHEFNEEKRKEKADALKDGLDAVAARDVSAINRAFDRFNRI